MQTQSSSFAGRIVEEACSWPGITVGTGPGGECSFRLHECEIGHLHDDGVVHFVFPAGLWLGLVADGHVEVHPCRRLGWAERRIESEQDVAEVIALLRLNYDRLARHPGIPPAALARST